MKTLPEEIEEYFPPDPRPALQIIEDEIKADRDAHLADDLMQRLIKAKEWARARKLAWFMWGEFGIDTYLETNK